jgi:2-oxoisovalerate dehydrogenase E2 component (dihydrolipoyl transacylase)
VEVVTDKVNAEIPSPFEGRLVRIQVAEGQTVAIGAALAEIEVEGPATTAAETAPPKEPASAPSPAVRAATKTSGERMSPAVRRQAHLARQAAAAAGGGAAAAIPAPAPRTGAREELVKVSAVRRQIAEHMVRSVTTSPHAWSLREVNVTRLVEYREAHREDFQARHGFPLSYLPFFIQIVCDALLDNPYLNSTWTDEGIVLKHYVNMGIAVALPDTLIVPVIKDADQKGFDDLAHALNDLATRARAKSLRPEDVQGGTFTLNNTGALGSVAGQSIINQPQAAILSTEAIKKRPVVVEDSIVIRPMMNLTMSFDHRIIDGLAASRFLNDVQRGIEEWSPAAIRL